MTKDERGMVTSSGIGFCDENDERGMVTVELAFGALFVAGFVVVVAWLISVLLLFAACQATAGEVARQEARGDRAAIEKVMQAAPDGAKVAISHSGDQVSVEVRLAAQPWADWLPVIWLAANSVVLAEAG